jgi:hypothetical protein
MASGVDRFDGVPSWRGLMRTKVRVPAQAVRSAEFHSASTFEMAGGAWTASKAFGLDVA